MNLEQWQRSKKIKAEAEAAAKRTVERVLNAVKEPAMSEFKVGDQIVKTNPNIKHAHIRTVIAITKSGGAVLDYSGYGYKAPRVRHATAEEIAAGHRIDKPSNSGELETLDKLENHISPLCKSKDV